MAKVAYETNSVIRSLVTELVAKHYDSCVVFLEAILEVESTPYTQNLHYLESSSSKWLAKYKDVRSRPEEKKSASIFKFAGIPSVSSPPINPFQSPGMFRFVFLLTILTLCSFEAVANYFRQIVICFPANDCSVLFASLEIPAAAAD